MMFALPYIQFLLVSVRSWLTDRWVKRLAYVLSLCLIANVALSPALVSAYAGLGGYVSEKLIGTATIASKYIGDSTSGPVVIGSAPTISTLSVASNNADGTTTLRGHISSLNGFPSTTTYFRYGGDALMSSSTPSVVVASTGEVTATVTGLDPGVVVYYQFVASGDSTAYGSTSSFVAGGGRGWSYFTLNNILTALIALGTFILILSLTHNPILSLLATVIGLLAIAIVKTLIESVM